MQMLAVLLAVQRALRLMQALLLWGLVRLLSSWG